MHQMQMARTPRRCSNPSLSSCNKATKAIGGTREEESKRDTKSPKSRSPKIHSQRDVLVWSKHRSRSPPTTPQIYARINGGVSINQAQRVRQMGAKLRQKEEEEATLKDKGVKLFKDI